MKKRESSVIMISACLVGINCRYDGKNSYNEECVHYEGLIVPFCPEQLGGAPTPRTPCEITGGSAVDVLAGEGIVTNKNGEDMTKIFIKGAEESLKLAELINPERIILKENSPSCGVEMVYDGAFSGRKVPGRGVTTALLMKNGFKVTSC